MNPTILAVKPLEFVWRTADPFLFCVHHDDAYPRGADDFGPAVPLAGRYLGSDFSGLDGFSMYHGRRVPGFPRHPHRGFETVTLVRRGVIDHSDSLGSAGRFGDGDAQWMTAGRGIQHAEMFPLLSRDADNPVELFQIWLNLPRRHKMVAPYYEMLWAERIPTVRFTDEAGKETAVTLVAGALAGTVPPPPPPDSWAAEPTSDVAIWVIRLDAGATWVVPAARPESNRTLYFFAGETLAVAGHEVRHGSGVTVRADADVPLRAGAGGAEVVVLQGRPIGEPVAQHGPFVMSTDREIQQAYDDFRATGFGGWPWDRPDPVHGRAEGRFARHADGRVERP
jgi:hypothetical protein